MKANHFLVAIENNNRITFATQAGANYITRENMAKAMGINILDIDFRYFELPVDDDSDLCLSGVYTIESANLFISQFNASIKRFRRLQKADEIKQWCLHFNGTAHPLKGL